MWRALLGFSLVLSAGGEPSSQVAAVTAPADKSGKIEKNTWSRDLAKTYGPANSVTMDVEKKVEYAFLDQTNESKGTMTFKDRNFRMELKGHEHSLVVVNKKQVRVFTFFPPDSGLKTQVLETTVDQKGQIQKIFTALLSGQGLEKEFELLKSEKKNGRVEMQLKPKADLPEVAQVSVTVSEDNSQIQEIAMDDQVGNKTRYLLSNVKFNQKIDPSVFDVAIPKDAVIERF